jgi:mono/diheme cytochrome c family protein
VSDARKEWGTTVIAAVVAAGIVFALRGALVRSPSQPNFEFLPDMVRGAAWQAQSAGAPSADGLTERPVPAGVVVRGTVPFRFDATPEDAARAGRELPSPFAADDASAVARGAEVYARFCTPCHGADGGGEGPAVRRGMTRPPSLLADRARQLPDGHLFHIVTLGQGNMASHAAQVPPDDRWRAVLHVRGLQKGGAR